jgi:hypothetical protein
LAAAV